MMRAGLIKRLGAGIYSYMPMGLRVIRKVEAIIREEMNRAGAVELLMPVVQPAELWQETGRFEKMGPELLRVKDRHERDFIIQPTSEEVITDIARQELRSYRAAAEEFLSHPDQVPRRAPAALRRDARARVHDEGRVLASTATSSRAGKQLRARCTRAYVRIFDRIGLTFRAVAADTGAIGGDRSHEFQVIADTGEDAIVYCPDSRLRRQHRAGRGAAADRAARRADAGRWPRRRRRARAPARTWPRCWACRCSAPSSRWCWPPTRRTTRGDVVEDHGLAAAGARRPRAERGQGRQGAGPEGRLPLRHRRRDRGPLRLQARLPRPDRHCSKPVKVVADRTVARDERLRLRRQRGRLPLHRRQLGPRPARARPGGRHPQRASPATRRPTARACWRSSAASRSATCSTSAPSTARR